MSCSCLVIFLRQHRHKHRLVVMMTAKQFYFWHLLTDDASCMHGALRDLTEALTGQGPVQNVARRRGQGPRNFDARHIAINHSLCCK